MASALPTFTSSYPRHLRVKAVTAQRKPPEVVAAEQAVARATAALDNAIAHKNRVTRNWYQRMNSHSILPGDEFSTFTGEGPL
jgi:hypothetical protein